MRAAHRLGGVDRPLFLRVSCENGACERALGAPGDRPGPGPGLVWPWEFSCGVYQHDLRVQELGLFPPVSEADLLFIAGRGARALPSAAVLGTRREGSLQPLRAPGCSRRGLPSYGPGQPETGPFTPLCGESKRSQVACPEPQLTSGQREQQSPQSCRLQSPQAGHHVGIFPRT